MGTKAMQPQTLFPGLTDAISSLFTAKTERPKERAEIFARALEQHLDEYFDQHLIKVLRDNKSAELFLRALEAEAPRATSKHKDIQTSGEIVSAGGGVDQAIADGNQFKQKILAQNDMLSAEQAGNRIGIKRQAVDERRSNNTIIGLTGLRRGVKYPAWQFEDKVAEVLPDILKILSHRDAWGKYLFFTQPEPLLGGVSPLDAIRKNSASEAIKVATLLAAEE